MGNEITEWILIMRECVLVSFFKSSAMVGIEERYRLIQSILKLFPDNKNLYKGNFGDAVWKARTKRNAIYSLLERIDKNYKQIDFSVSISFIEMESKILILL